MISWRSIEFRLAAWYSLLLLAGLASLGAVLWFGVNYSMVAAVDDLLAARVTHLVDLIDVEFGSPFLDSSDEREERKFKATVDRVDPGREWLSVKGEKIYFTPETVFESDSGVFDPRDLREGQYVEVEIERRNGDWFASEVSLEPGLEQKLLEELYEYSLAAPNGRMIQIRSATGRQILPPGSDSSPHLIVPWQAVTTDEASVLTIEASGDPFRVLVRPVVLAGGRYQIQVGASLAPVVAARERLVWWLLWSIPIGVSLGFAGGYTISRAALRPVEEVARLAARIDVSRLSERLAVPPTGDVVQVLAQTFNAMLSRLETAVQQLQQFTADASHELRSPISVIRTTAELALRQGRTDQDLREDMKEIHDEAKRLTELIEDLLTLARADAGTDAAPMSDVDLVSLAGEVCDQHRLLANGRTLDLQLETASATVQGHEPSLRRLLIILLDNAVQHTPVGASIRVTVQGHNEHLMVSVADTGEGIPAEELDRVFDRFYRFDPARNRAKGGSGLGLSIAKWITDSHAGGITVSSEVGKGSIFRVRLPRRQKARPAEAASSHKTS